VTGFFRSLSHTNPAILKFASLAALAVAALGPLLLIMGTMVAMIPNLITGFALLKSGMSFLLVFAKLGKIFAVLAKIGPIIMIALKGIGAVIVGITAPVWGIVAAVVAAVAALTNLVLRWDKIKKGFGKGLGSGIKTFFGFGDDESEKKDLVQKNKGEALGADRITKKSQDFVMRQRKSQVDVNFANLPGGAKINKDDKANMLNIFNGPVGAFYWPGKMI